MTNLEVTLEIILNCLMLAFLAAMIRVLFSKLDSFVGTLKIFIGSVLFGVTAGYICNDFEFIKPYIKVIVVVSSIFGKELYLWTEKIFVDPLKHLSVIVKIITMFKGIQIQINNKPKKEEE